MGLEDILLGDPTVAIAGVSTGRERQMHVKLLESRHLLHPARSHAFCCKGCIFLLWGVGRFWEEMGTEGDFRSVLPVVADSASLAVPTVSQSYEDAVGI